MIWLKVDGFPKILHLLINFDLFLAGWHRNEHFFLEKVLKLFCRSNRQIFQMWPNMVRESGFAPRQFSLMDESHITHIQLNFLSPIHFVPDINFLSPAKFDPDLLMLTTALNSIYRVISLASVSCFPNFWPFKKCYPIFRFIFVRNGSKLVGIWGFLGSLITYSFANFKNFKWRHRFSNFYIN